MGIVTETTCRETSTEMAKFGYWNIQGLGQPCRIALHYTGVEVEDTVWEIQKRNEWVAAKGANEWGLDFPNLPYYSDGEVKLTQSDAILRHLGRKNGLYGCSDADTAMVDMLIDTAKDIKMSLVLPNVYMRNLNVDRTVSKWLKLSVLLSGTWEARRTLQESSCKI